MTHASVPEKERKVLGISDTLIRLSVGLENEADIIEDLDQALNAAVNNTHSTQHDPISHCHLALRILCPVNLDSVQSVSGLSGPQALLSAHLRLLIKMHTSLCTEQVLAYRAA